jgi:hypothetical protein
MSAFTDGQEVEQQGYLALLPWLNKVSGGKHNNFALGPSVRRLQVEVGDFIYESAASFTTYSVELKVERSNRHGNFFLEIFSNKSADRPKPGWMMTCASDQLWYYFLAEDALHIINRRRLYNWAFGEGADAPGRIGGFPLRAQQQREQLNLTVGACVPIAVVEAEVGFHLRHPIAEMGGRPLAA